MSSSNFKYYLTEWKITMDEANYFFEHKQYTDALPLYEKSLLFSELMLRNAQEADEFGFKVISTFSVSCINMANNFRAAMEEEKAGAYLLYNVWQLKMLSKKEGITKTLYRECFGNWQKAVTALTVFHQETHRPLTVNFWKEETYTRIQQAKTVMSVQNAAMN